MPQSSTESSPPSARDWQEALALLDTALELDPAAEQAWLASLPVHHAHLTPLLRRLLDARAEIGTKDFMAAPVPPPPGAEVEPAATPTDVGPYRLLRQIGRGGMATVWLAQRADGVLGRQVALKLPHVGWGTASFVQRMARERNILASLSHANIARLYDAGVTADGQPYLALEYVEGEPIDAYAARNGLDLHARVALIVQVARAVAHAHGQLVVHRDLKPSNILVDSQGQVHLLDFGIAKFADAADDTQLTHSHGPVLTPDYASPEQIRGDVIGTVSDVFSLGVVLFELLAGARPYRLPKGLGATGLADAIGALDIPRPSDVAEPGLRRQLRGDLDAIVGRATRLSGAERYQTIDAFADDLDRHLRGEPVQARPSSRWYRTERWMRRHPFEAAMIVGIVIAVPAGAAAQAAVLAAIAVGAAVALWQARRARQQTRVARSEAARAATVKQFLISLFESGSLAADGGAQLGQMSVHRFVERAARRIDSDLEQEPVVKNELLGVVSALFAGLSDGAATVDYAQQWRRSQQRFGTTDAERARAAQRLAKGLALLGRAAEAAKTLQSAIAALRRSADTAAAATLIAHLLIDLARLQVELGQRSLALEGVADALVLVDGRKTDGADREASAAFAAAMFFQAELTAADNRLDEAKPKFEEAIARVEQLHGPNSVDVGRLRFLYAGALATDRRSDEAESEYRAAMRLFREGGGETDINAAIVALDLGRQLSLRGDRLDEAKRLLSNARDVFEARADSVAPLYPAQAALYLAEALIDAGELEAAREPMEAAAALYRDRVENAPQQTLAALIHARFLSDTGDYRGAADILESAHAQRVSLMGPAHPLTASVVNRIGLNLMRDEQLDAAQAAFESILGSDDQAESLWGSVKHMAQQNVAVVQLERGCVSLARPVIERNLARYDANVESTPNALMEASLRLNAGRAQLLDNEPALALLNLQRCADFLHARYPQSPTLATAYSWLGLCRLSLGEREQARELAERAEAVLRARPTAGPHFRRGHALLRERLAATQAAA